jgi:hypothetical protein
MIANGFGYDCGAASLPAFGRPWPFHIEASISFD